MASLTYEDKGGQQELFNKQVNINSDSDDDISDSDQEISKVSNCWDEISKITTKRVKKLSKSKSKAKKNKDDDIDLNDIYVDLGTFKKPINTAVRKMADPEDLMQNTVIAADFNRLHEVPTLAISDKRAQKERKKEREKTTGSKWFNMPAPEMTEELSKDLDVIKMRAALDPKQFYKKNTMTSQPKYFQVGRIVETSADFYHGRIAKKDRKKTLVDELLADAEFKKYNKRRYKEIIVKQKQTDRKAMKHAKKLKKKNK